MDNCKTELTYVYSSPCISYLRELIGAFNKTFYTKVDLDEMFWYGVACNAETYANFKNYNMCGYDVPEVLTNGITPPLGKLVYVKEILKQVIKREINKPDWMFFVEENESFNKFSDSPSTFLILIPKDEKYKKLGEALTNFLYSPNMLITLKK